MSNGTKWSISIFVSIIIVSLFFAARMIPEISPYVSMGFYYSVLVLALSVLLRGILPFPRAAN
jgi:hypothetical protein